MRTIAAAVAFLAASTAAVAASSLEVTVLPRPGFPTSARDVSPVGARLVLVSFRNGKVLDRLPVPSAPEVIKLRGNRLQVRTYDRQVVVQIAAG